MPYCFLVIRKEKKKKELNQVTFVFLETGSLYAGQAGLELVHLLSAGITGMYHHA
jgi:hypothetical protein